jgi:import inner membrane translocase subunit TIM44
MSGGFFDQLRQSLKKEVEQNKEFKESLSKLRKETGDLTGKAQENSSKLAESMHKLSSTVSSRLNETKESLSKSSQVLMSQLKEKVGALQAEESEKKGEGARRESPSPVKSHAEVSHKESPTSSKSASSHADGHHESHHESLVREGGRRRTLEEASQAAEEDPVNASGAGDSAGRKEEASRDETEASSTSSSSGGTGAGSGASGGKENVFTRWLAGRPPREAVRVFVRDFQVGLREAFADLFGMREKSTGMRKHIYQQRASEADGEAGKQEGEEEEGEAGEEEKKNAGGALVVVKQQQKTWERLAEQLRDAPIIQEILKAGTKLADTELGRQAGKLRGKLQDRVEDARELWETSQNPIVYKLSSMWDDLTSETELGIALREIRRADPDFVVEDWVNTLSESFLPLFFKAYLKGDLKTLKPYLSEGMYRQMAEEFRLRKAEGLALDPHVLEISNAEIVQAKLHDHQPVLVLGTLIQHINCVRNREGAIVEGKEDEVRASFYLLLFVREYDEKEGALQWKIQERYLGFSQPFI